MTSELQRYRISGSDPRFVARLAGGGAEIRPFSTPNIWPGLNMIEIHGGDPLLENVAHVPMDVFQMMLDRHHSDNERMATLEKEVAELRQQVERLGAEPEIRAVGVEQAYNEIRAYFEDHHGEVIYPSDVAETLGLDYDQVVAGIASLEANGEIKKT